MEVGKERKMTNEQAIEILKAHHMWTGEPQEIIDVRKENKALEMAIQSLSQEATDIVSRGAFEQVMRAFDIAVGQLKELGYGLGQKIEPCDDAVSREAVLDEIEKWIVIELQYTNAIPRLIKRINELPPVTQKSGKCKNCKYFEYDSVAKVDGVPLIVAHEICNKWGDGCKTKDDGYCFLFEPQESEE